MAKDFSTLQEKLIGIVSILGVISTAMNEGCEGEILKRSLPAAVDHIHDELYDLWGEYDDAIRECERN